MQRIVLALAVAAFAAPFLPAGGATGPCEVSIPAYDAGFWSFTTQAGSGWVAPPDFVAPILFPDGKLLGILPVPRGALSTTGEVEVEVDAPCADTIVFELWRHDPAGLASPALTHTATRDLPCAPLPHDEALPVGLDAARYDLVLDWTNCGGATGRTVYELVLFDPPLGV